MAADYGSLPFSQQIAFFRKKENLGTRAYTDIWQAQHDHAFVVAGAMRRALLTDLRNAVDRVIAEGVTLQQFRKDFRAIVAKHGWTGWKGEGSKKGEAWRTQTIYDTNLRTSFAAGRLQQMRDLKEAMPYWRYRHNDSVQYPRPEHVAWDGLVLRSDDPFWSTHYPPNGWGCKCYVEPLTDDEVKALDGPDEAPPVDMQEEVVGTQGPSPRRVETPRGIDPGFGYQPGDSWMQTMAARQIETDMLLPSVSAAAEVDALPAPRPQPAVRVLANDLDDEEYVDAFLGEFGVARGERATIFRDVADEHLVISDALFTSSRGGYKIDKRGRAPYVKLLADAVKLPDEIWEDFADVGGKVVTRRRYVARFAVAESEVPALAVFETGPSGWVGVTALKADDAAYLERKARIGKRVYRRD